MTRNHDNLIGSWVEDTVREIQRRQSELQDVEAKRASKDVPRHLYKTLSAFGNREGGGIILLGVDETNKYVVSGVEDVARTQRDLVNYAQTEMSYPLRLEVTVADVDDRQVVAVTVMEAPFAQKPVYYRRLGLDSGSFCRSGTSNVRMTPEQIWNIIAGQAEMREDYSARLIATLPNDWYDVLELERLRRILRGERSGSDLDRLPDDELLLKLQLTEDSGGKNVPTVAGLLLVGRDEHLRQHVPEHEVIFLRHTDATEEYDMRADLKSPLLAILEAVTTNLEATNRIVPIHLGLVRHEIPRYHPKVYREALLNAVIHRSYPEYGSIMVQQYPDRLEISNPGGFLPGVGPNTLLSGRPKHRNRRLAEAFQLIGLVERAGMGVRKMYRFQLENGKPPPEYGATENAVQVSISTEQVDERMAAYVVGQYKAGHRLDVADLLVLTRLRSAPDVRTPEAAELTQRPPRAAATLLNEMVGKNFLRRRGTGKGTRYTFSPALARELGFAPRAARDASIDQIRHREMVLQYVREHGSIANRQCQELCDLSPWQASKLLRRLHDEQLLERQGASRKYTRYVLREG
jgi:ATP-dependent DNA helicase RecG